MKKRAKLCASARASIKPPTLRAHKWNFEAWKARRTGKSSRVMDERKSEQCASAFKLKKRTRNRARAHTHTPGTTESDLGDDFPPVSSLSSDVWVAMATL